MTDYEIPEALARAIFVAAISENRCSELLCALFEGGSATIDRTDGSLVIVDGVVLDQLEDDDPQ